jgi:soluble cytochrome b562
MSKQTAVQWLIKELKDFGYYTYNLEKLCDQAKQMEKEQRFQDFKEGFQAALESLQGANNLVQNKTFGGNNEQH